VDNQSARTHLLDRTSPKGEYFIGTCRLCGTQGLRMEQANERCANPTGVTAEQAILDAIAGGPAPTEAGAGPDHDNVAIRQALDAGELLTFARYLPRGERLSIR
jgi:hypothetical protein